MSVKALRDRMEATVARRIAATFAANDHPVAIGLAGTQGSGKSTLAPRLAARLTASGLRTAILALDDFYLTRAERQALARDVHPLLATRGVPGTHDVTLLRQTLGMMLDGEPVAVPRFDKASDDRVAPAGWDRIEAPVDIVILEGWCVGARPQPDEALDLPVNALERDEDADGRWRRWVNERLADEYAGLFGGLATRVFLRAPDFDVVLRWRAEQEAGLETRGMSAAELARFVAHYERLTRWMLADEPAELVVDLDPARVPRGPVRPPE